MVQSSCEILSVGRLLPMMLKLTNLGCFGLVIDIVICKNVLPNFRGLFVI
jgi:hypothetical protein